MKKAILIALRRYYLRVVNTAELKNKTNRDDLEDFIIENSPSIGKKIMKAEKDLKAGRVISLDECLSTQGDKER